MLWAQILILTLCLVGFLRNVYGDFERSKGHAEVGFGGFLLSIFVLALLLTVFYFAGAFSRIIG